MVAQPNDETLQTINNAIRNFFMIISMNDESSPHRRPRTRADDPLAA
jgi:hypothetical protein